MKSEFRCGKCLRIKKGSLFGFTYKVGTSERIACSNCKKRINEAEEKRKSELVA